MRSTRDDWTKVVGKATGVVAWGNGNFVNCTNACLSILCGIEPMKKKINNSERRYACVLGMIFLAGIPFVYFHEIAGSESVKEGSLMFMGSCIILSTYFFFVSISGRRPWI